jgi:hypothetical protein
VQYGIYQLCENLALLKLEEILCLTMQTIDLNVVYHCKFKEEMKYFLKQKSLASIENNSLDLYASCLHEVYEN